MGSPRLVWLVLAALAMAVPRPATAQFMFIDLNGDGAYDSQDYLDPSYTSLDVWLDTDHNADGSVATCDADSQTGLTLQTYSVILHSTGAITYGSWTDALGFDVNPVEVAVGADFYVSRSGVGELPAGKHRLGTLAISGLWIETKIFIVSATSAAPDGYTGFGTACPGLDGDGAYKLGQDWWDAAGTWITGAVIETTWGEIKSRYR